MNRSHRRHSVDQLVPVPRYFLPVSFSAHDSLALKNWRFVPEAKALVSLLVWKQAVRDVDRNGYTRLHSQWLKTLLSRNYAAVIKGLQESETIERTNYSSGRFSCGYRLAPRFASDTVITELVESRVMANRLAKWWQAQQLEQQARWQPIHHELDRRQRIIAIDRETALSELSRAKVKATGKARSNCILAQSALVEAIASSSHRLSVGRASERVSTSCGLLKRAIRHNALSVGGNHLVEVDLKSSQPSLLAMLLAIVADMATGLVAPSAHGLIQGMEIPVFRDAHKQDFRDYVDTVLSDDVYERLRDEASEPLTRRQVKRRTMRDVLAKRWKYQSDVEDAFRDLWPSVYRYVREVNQRDYKRTLIVLQTMEARLVTQTACRILADRLPADTGFVPIHDCLLVPDGYQESAKTVFADISTELGFLLRTEVKGGSIGGGTDTDGTASGVPSL